MAEPSPETAPQKKSKKGKITLGVLLTLLLILGIAGCSYVASISSAWNNGTQKFSEEQVFPGDDGAVNEETLKEFKKNYEAAQTKVTESEDGKQEEQSKDSDTSDTRASHDKGKVVNSQGINNVTEQDSDGDGIPDSVEGGAVTPRPAATGAKNILLLGSDSRAGTPESIHVSGQRADTIMILHVPGGGADPYLISIMRDTWVNIPGYGAAKINAALNYGGVGLQIATLEQLLGVRIDHVAEIDFSGFKSLTDALGGVTVQVPFNFTADSYSFTAGPNHMNGNQALAFVRQRYAFSDGDYQRVRNQRAFMRGLLQTITSKGAFTSATELRSVIDSIAPYVTVDSGLNASTLFSMGAPYISSGGTRMHMLTLPNAGTGWSVDGQSIVVLDSNATAALSQALRSDTMGSYTAVYGED
ncbi:LCP family protein [Rothia sp. P6271]|uniref:LCP family protein n=1 Tax=unclassified Rothia (in: high G+C Gram-positive bacteria) TaxID=2689056 RepID=UPI003AC9302F